jgi:hypothetical protein
MMGPYSKFFFHFIQEEFPGGVVENFIENGDPKYLAGRDEI